MRHESGFTLIEGACAFSIISLLMTAAFASSAQRHRQVAACWHQTIAYRVAASRIEVLETPVPGSVTFAPEANSLPRATGRQTVRARSARLFEITVEVSWQAPGASRRSIELTTLRWRKEAR